MLQPKKLKYRKLQKGRSLKRNVATRGTILIHGDFGLKSLESKFITDRQIEAMVKSVKKVLGKRGRLWLRIFPHKPITKKPAEVRMGGGKGDLDHYVALVHPGRILFEVSANNVELALASLKAAAYKLPIKTKIIKR
jgi:large subunit ribosomal protein L16